MAGIVLLGTVVASLLLNLSQGEDLLSTLAKLPYLLLICLPGVVLLLCGVQLYREMSVEAFKWVLGFLVLSGMIMLASLPFDFRPEILPERLYENASFFIFCCLSVMIYLCLLRWGLPHLDPHATAAQASLGKGVLVLLAVLLWMLLSEIFRVYAPKEEGYEYVPRWPWGLVGFVVSLVIPCVLYRLAVLRFVKK